MSELVEMVSGIIETHIAACEPPDAIARAAIAAVAEWLEHRDPDHWHSAEMMRFTARKLEEQLEQPK